MRGAQPPPGCTLFPPGRWTGPSCAAPTPGPGGLLRAGPVAKGARRVGSFPQGNVWGLKCPPQLPPCSRPVNRLICFEPTLSIEVVLGHHLSSQAPIQSSKLSACPWGKRSGWVCTDPSRMGGGGCFCPGCFATPRTPLLTAPQDQVSPRVLQACVSAARSSLAHCSFAFLCFSFLQR